MFNKKYKWYRITHRLYCRQKLEAPYDSLFRYYFNIAMGKPVYGNGHYDFFSMLRFDDITNGALCDLRTILPQHLLDNLLGAYEAFNTFDDDTEVDVIIDTMAKYDDYADDHAEEIADILREYISEIKGKKI